MDANKRTGWKRAVRIACLALAGLTLAGCVVVPVGPGWHRSYYYPSYYPGRY
jgi:hypothetical protein